MIRRKCSRIWIVEAVRDGRVLGAELEAFGRHFRSCADCQEESRALDELRQGLRSLPSPEAHPLAVRRSRQRLMAEADAAMMMRARSTSPVPIVAGLIILIALVLAFGWRSRLHRDPQMP